MKKEELRKAWFAAAVVTGAIISAIFIYALVVEIISRTPSFRAPLTGAAAAAARYALYLLGLGAVFPLRFIRPALTARGGTASQALSALLKKAVVTAALCEVPAFAGLLLFFLVRAYWDFYLLAVFSAGLELFFFPKYREWEETIRNGYGPGPE